MYSCSSIEWRGGRSSAPQRGVEGSQREVEGFLGGSEGPQRGSEAPQRGVEGPQRGVEGLLGRSEGPQRGPRPPRGGLRAS